MSPDLGEMEPGGVGTAGVAGECGGSNWKKLKEIVPVRAPIVDSCLGRNVGLGSTADENILNKNNFLDIVVLF